MRLWFFRDIFGVEDVFEIIVVFGYKDDFGGEIIVLVFERSCFFFFCCVIILFVMFLCVL